jgi:hypothetical protein
MFIGSRQEKSPVSAEPMVAGKDIGYYGSVSVTNMRRCVDIIDWCCDVKRVLHDESLYGVVKYKVIS